LHHPNHSIAAINPGAGDKQNKTSRVEKTGTNKTSISFDLRALLVDHWEFCTLLLKSGHGRTYCGEVHGVFQRRRIQHGIVLT